MKHFLLRNPLPQFYGCQQQATDSVTMNYSGTFRVKHKHFGVNTRNYGSYVRPVNHVTFFCLWLTNRPPPILHHILYSYFAYVKRVIKRKETQPKPKYDHPSYSNKTITSLQTNMSPRGTITSKATNFQNCSA